jgi:K+-sensing histidine kinase KdpD
MDASKTRVHGGLGLGLSIVRHIIEAHGGSVSADSEGLQRGATFSVMLPLRAVEEIAPGHTFAPETVGATGRRSSRVSRRRRR